MDDLQGNILLKRIIWGYPHLWKSPNGLSQTKPGDLICGQQVHVLIEERTTEFRGKSQWILPILTCGVLFVCLGFETAIIPKLGG